MHNLLANFIESSTGAIENMLRDEQMKKEFRAYVQNNKIEKQCLGKSLNLPIVDGSSSMTIRQFHESFEKFKQFCTSVVNPMMVAKYIQDNQVYILEGRP